MLDLCYSRFSVYVKRESKLPNKYNTGRNFALKEIKKFEQFKKRLIQNALLKGIHELFTGNCRGVEKLLVKKI